MKHAFFFLPLLYAASLLANQECIAYEAHFNPLFLQPNASNLYYGAEAKPLPIPSPNWESLEIRPDYHFGFEAGVSGICSEKNIKISLNWEHLYAKDSASRHVSITDMVGPYFNIGPDAEPYKIAHGHVTHHFDEINLSFEKPYICAQDLEINYFAGLVFTRIKQSLTSNFSNNEGTITRKITTPSQFTGVGPECGFNCAYFLCRNLSITCETALSLLTGIQENHTTFESTSPLLAGLSITPPNTQTTRLQDRTQVVPGLSEKIGFSYMANYCNHIIHIGFGYQVQAYLNAIQSVEMGSEVTTPPEAAEVGVYALGFRRTLSNFLLSGPYLTFNIEF